MEDDDHDQDDNSTHHVKSEQESSRTLESYFPSLACLSLRHDSINEVDLAKLWPFFRRCPRLTNVDLENNHIASLKNVAHLTTTQMDLRSETQEMPQMALRELNLAGNPCCNFSPTSSYNLDHRHIDEFDREREVDIEDESDTNSESQEDTMRAALGRTEMRIDTRHIRRSVSQDEHLLRIITANPRLVSLLVCRGKCKLSNDSNNNNESDGGQHHDYCTCFQKSALYSPSVRYALDLNRCSRGKTLLGTRMTISYGKGYNTIPTSLSLSKWPFVFERVNRIFDHRSVHSGHTISACLNMSSEKFPGCPGRVFYGDRINSTERQASVIYCLLQGPVFAARGSIPSIDEIPFMLRELKDRH